MSEDKATDALRRLLETMATLRSPAGCPWDAEQTPQSLKPYLLEEAYEVLEAIDGGDTSAIRDELGDLLLQIVFHARIFEERGEFDFGDVASAICEKLIRRHPHVFAGGTTSTLHELNAQWERIKASERRERHDVPSLLDRIPATLPALARARKMIRKAAQAGFGRQEPGEAFGRIRELLAELEDRSKTVRDFEKTESRLGEILFILAGVADQIDVDAEEALRQSIESFRIGLNGRSPEGTSSEGKRR